MSSSILRLISQKGAAESSIRFSWISRKGASGIFRSANCCGGQGAGWISRKVASGIFRSPNCCGGQGAGISTMSVSSSVLGGPSSLHSRISPWLMLPPAFEGGDMVYKFYSLAENKVLNFNKRGSGRGDEEELEQLPDDDAKCVGSSHGWLALFNKRNCDLFLSNPLSRRLIKLPPIHTLPIPKENLRGGFGCVHKIIISCSPDEEECRAMMIFAPESRLAFCWPGRSSEWTPIGSLFRKRKDGNQVRAYKDLVYSSTQKLFYCITNYDDFEAWDLRDPRSPRMIPMDVSLGFDNYKHSSREELEEEFYRQVLYSDCCITTESVVVAEQSDELFYVTRFVMERMGPDGFPVEDIYHPDEGYDDSVPYKTIDFDVRKYNREDRTLRLMDSSLDGLALFIGSNQSFALSAKEFPELKPNAIYFTDVLEPRDLGYDLPYGGHDLGIFNYANRALSPCYYPCDVQSIKRIQPAPMWFTPSPH